MLHLKPGTRLRKSITLLTTKRKSKKRTKEFSDVYDLNLWSSEDSTSGVGSTITNTVTVREILLHVIKQYKIGTILDAPCGDFNWLSKFFSENTELQVSYLGLDVVPKVVANNKVSNVNEYCHFEIADLASHGLRLPEYDLIICRDLLVHLSLKDGRRVIKNFRQSNSRFLLITHFQDSNSSNFENAELTMNFGHFGWRPLNMLNETYELGKPIKIWNECSSEELPDNLVKTLALFDLQRKIH